MAEECYFHTDTNGYIMEPVSIGSTKVFFAKADVNYKPYSNISEVTITGQLRPESQGNSYPIDFSRTGRFRYRIEKVVFSGPATILFWTDGTKTVVRLRKGDRSGMLGKKPEDDRRVAICWAMAKRYYGSCAAINKRISTISDFRMMDNTLVYTMLVTLFDDPKALERYIDHAMKIAKDYNEQ